MSELDAIVGVDDDDVDDVFGIGYGADLAWTRKGSGKWWLMKHTSSRC